MSDTVSAQGAGKEGGMPTNDKGNSVEPQSFESWLGSQGEDVRRLYDEHTSGLKSALQSERLQRGDLAKQLRDATAKLENGSLVRSELEQTVAKLDLLERRASFYEEALSQGVANARLAFLAAQESDSFEKGGKVRWDKLKAEYPELFASGKPAATNAGAGAGSQPGKVDMNAMIRRRAGRQ